MFHHPVVTLRPVLVAGCLCAALLAPVAAVAEEPAALPMYEGFNGTACEAEFVEHCSDKGTKGRGYTCLRELVNREALTAGCAEHADKLRNDRQAEALARHKAWADVCAEDVPKFCAQYAGAKAKTIKGCLRKKRDELSEASNEKLPIRATGNSAQGGTPARARWRDGSEPDDWALQNALESRPRKTKEELEEIGRDAWIERDNAQRAQKIANGKAKRAAAAAAAAKAEAEAAEE